MLFRRTDAVRRKDKEPKTSQINARRDPVTRGLSNIRNADEALHKMNDKIQKVSSNTASSDWVTEYGAVEDTCTNFSDFGTPRSKFRAIGTPWD